MLFFFVYVDKFVFVNDIENFFFCKIEFICLDIDKVVNFCVNMVLLEDIEVGLEKVLFIFYFFSEDEVLKFF